MTPILTRAAFESWLARFSEEAVIGIACDGGACPLARYLTSRAGLGYATAVVDSFTIHTRDRADHEAAFPTPTWAYDFITDADEHEHYITAGTAREILARIPEEATQ